MTRRSLQVLTGSVLALALVIMGAGFPAKTVPPKQYAKRVCTALHTWDDGAQASQATLRKKSTGAGADFPKLKKVLVAYISTTEKVLSTATKNIGEAGTPDTPQGKQAAAALKGGFVKAHAAFARLHNDVAKFPAGNPIKAAAAIKTLSTKMNGALGGLNNTFKNVSKHDPKHKLQKAFAATQVCQASGS